MDRKIQRKRERVACHSSRASQGGKKLGCSSPSRAFVLTLGIFEEIAQSNNCYRGEKLAFFTLLLCLSTAAVIAEQLVQIIILYTTQYNNSDLYGSIHKSMYYFSVRKTFRTLYNSGFKISLISVCPCIICPCGTLLGQRITIVPI